MTEQQWRRVWQIFRVARDLEPDALDAYMESLDDETIVLAEVRAMLEEAAETAEPEEAPSPESRIGTVLDHYEIKSLLGSGGMGQVYAALDAELNRMVALKFLPLDRAASDDDTEQLLREAKAASALNHPQIVTVYEVIRFDDQVAIAMELVEGKALRHYCGEPQPVQQVVAWGLQMAQALAAASQQGIVHRDIKPENVMVREDGIVKILDFGLSARMGSEGNTSSLGIPMGTLQYMAPEQLRGETATPASDMFSLGLVLYELATGKHPFRGDSPLDTAQAIASKELGQIDIRLPGALRSLLLRILAKDPALRPSASEVAQSLNVVTAERPRISRRAFVTASATILSIGAPLAWWAARSRVEPDVEESLSLKPITSSPGLKDGPAFSPDGTRVAFAWDGGVVGAALNIYVMEIGTTDAQRLSTSVHEDAWPSWSPDGRNIAFVRRISGSETYIYVKPADGQGEGRQVWPGAVAASWSPDGKHLVLSNPRPPLGSGGIVRLSLETGEHEVLTAPKDAADTFPRYSPDGEWIAFMRRTGMIELFAMPAQGGTPKQLTFDGMPKVAPLAWTADSQEIVFSRQREFGAAGLWRVPVSGGESKRVAPLLQFAGSPAISKDGRRLIYAESWRDTNIYRLESDGLSPEGVPGPFGLPKRMISSSREDHSPSYSPDGSRIAFVSNRSGKSELWIAQADGSEQVQLTHLEGFAGSPSWSPDGQFLAFDLLMPRACVLTISTQGGIPQTLTSNRFDSKTPIWSPDGAWIYFASNQSGRGEIWKMRRDGNDPMPLTRGGADNAQLSADGTTVFFTRRVIESDLWQIPADGGTEQPVAGMESFNRIGRSWGVHAEGIYFVSRGHEGQGKSGGESSAREDAVQFFSFSTRQITELGATQERSFYGPISLSRDGRQLLLVKTDQYVSDLMVIENFQ